MDTPVFIFAAYSNVGKTTYLERLIPCLKEAGLRVGVVKHDAHDFQLDIQGKDTWRFAAAGADAVAIASLVNAFTTGKSLSYPAGSPLRSYKARFESTQYPGFYYSLTYVEYAEDVEIDGESYGRFFLRSAFEDIFVPVGDEIHRALGYTD